MKQNRDIKDILNEHGIKPTLIRIKILEFLISSKEHPDVETIFKEIATHIPTLSRTSVYNTLNILVKHNLIREIKIEGGQIRYDGSLERHAHFKCVKCGKLFDVKLDCNNDNCLPNVNCGKIIQEHIYFIGICENCDKKN